MIQKKHKAQKVLSFSRDAEFYFEMAESAVAKSDFAVALSSLFRALKADKNNIDYKVRLAEVYTMIEQYDASNNIYFEVYGDDKTATDVFYGIGQNYFYQGNLDAAVYYLNSFAAANLDVDDFDSAEAIRLFEESMSDEFVKDDYRLVYPEKPPTAEGTLSIAKNLARQEKFEEAAEMYEAAMRLDSGNSYIKNSLAMTKIHLKKYDEAEKLSLDALENDTDDYFALCNLCVIYHTQEDTQKRESALKRLLSYETEDTGEIFKTASVLCEIGEHKSAAQYLYRIHRTRPYDDNIIFLIALAEYNSGNYEASLKYFVKLLQLFEHDTVAEYYIKYVKGVIDGAIKKPEKLLPYSPSLPAKETEKRLKLLSATASLPNDELVKKWRGEDLFALCDWAISMGDNQLGTSVARLVARIADPSADRYLRDLLLDVNSGNVLRKEIIRILTLSGNAKHINYLYDDIFTTVTPKYPKTLESAPAVFSKAFALAFAVLCFVTEGFEQKMSRTLSAMIKCAASKEKEFSELTCAEAVAAVLCYKMGAGKLMSKKSFLCGAFEIDLKTFNKYLAALS